MTIVAEALPDDPGMLKEMLLAERAESERLRQIIREMQHHRFGRRAESLPTEQLLLGLEEVEQVEAVCCRRHLAIRRIEFRDVGFGNPCELSMTLPGANKLRSICIRSVS